MKLLSLASLAFVVITLSGCGAKHYQVCMSSAETGQAGCSHKRFTKQAATDIGKLLAAEPVSDTIEVWIEDARKHAKQAAPTPQANPEPPNADTKI